MINKITKRLERICKDYKNIENYKEAVKSPLRFDLHHRREISENKSRKDLIAENLYYDRPAAELVFLEHGEHMRLHNANRSEETKKKISDAMKGKNVGKHRSAAARKKMSEAHKGKHPSAESRQRMSDVKKGRHWHLENGKHAYTE